MDNNILIVVLTLLVGGAGGGFIGWLASGKQRKAVVNGEIARKDQVIGETWASLVDSLRLQIADLKAIIEEKERRITDLERQHVALDVQIKALEAKIGLEQQVASLTLELRALQTKLENSLAAKRPVVK